MFQRYEFPGTGILSTGIDLLSYLSNVVHTVLNVSRCEQRYVRSGISGSDGFLSRNGRGTYLRFILTYL